MKDKYQIFVSYSHKYEEIAAFIVSKLSDAGFSCFMAKKEILPAQQWNPTTRDALVSSGKLLILLTPRSKDSKWVAAEAGAAWGLGKEIIPAVMFVEPMELIEIINQWQSYSVETPTQVDLLINKLKLAGSKESVLLPSSSEGEDFINHEYWKRLIKIGEWRICERDSTIVGKGSYRYLLSSQEYGFKPYEIEADISFELNENSASTINAGIVLGWDDAKKNPMYHHLMFTGHEIIVEVIGKNGGGEGDFQHLTRGHGFTLRYGAMYSLKVRVSNSHIKLNINGKSVFEASIPSLGSGRVGLRPWRSKMTCKKFRVYELQN